MINDSFILKQNLNTLSLVSNNVNQKANSRPSSVIGDVHVINIEANNQQNLTSFKSTSVSVGTQPQIENSDQPINFSRGSSGNPVRNSSRNRLRFSAGPEATCGVEGASKSVDSSKVPTFGTSRAFIAGHSRAASADISGYATLGYGKHNSTHNAVQSSLSAIKAEPNKASRNLHHVRNNSVDNSLVTSGYKTFAINSDSQTSIVASSGGPPKPAIPVKPSGIVSVFVPGSTNLTHSANNKSTGNIYGKVNLNITNSQLYGKEPNLKAISSQMFNNSTSTSTLAGPSTQKVNNSIYPVPPPRKVF